MSTITHNLDVLEIALSQFSKDLNERRLAFVDQNRDLYITPVLKEHPVRARARVCVYACACCARVCRCFHFFLSYPCLLQIKLQTMVDTVAWNDSSDMLAALADGKLVSWLYPGIAFVDKDLIEFVCFLLWCGMVCVLCLCCA